MNFTSDVKKELISHKITGKGAERAALSAFVRTSGLIIERDNKKTFAIISETENVAEYFYEVFEDLYNESLSVTGAIMDRMSGRDKISFECSIDNSESIMNDLKLIHKNGKERNSISSSFKKTSDEAISYIKGAFLGGGSCILPSKESNKTGYHLEFVFSNIRTAEDFCFLISEFELIAKVVERNGAIVVYIKSKEAISDFLSIIGAENALNKFSEIVEERDKANRDNRTNNCYAGNADKAAKAAVKQVIAIEKLKDNNEIENLEPGLKMVAEARLENPSLSMKELSEKLGLSKSCFNHRMIKLLDIVKKLEENV